MTNEESIQKAREKIEAFKRRIEDYKTDRIKKYPKGYTKKDMIEFYENEVKRWEKLIGEWSK